MNSILLIDKQPGITSFDTLRELKKILRVKKIGHCGTLDKFASGLLVVCTGWTTKLTGYILESNKRYTGRIKLGIVTDTCDPEGKILAVRNISGKIDSSQIMEIRNKFTGEQKQIPPQYSALKIGGKRSSDLLREGKEVSLEPRMIFIHDLDVTEIDLDNSTITIDVTCSKGTYIRSLARDIGEFLGTGGHLESLRRIESGNFSVNDAATIDELREEEKSGFISGSTVKYCMRPEHAFSKNSFIIVDDTAKNKIFNGAFFHKDGIIDMNQTGKRPFVLLDEMKNLIAIADVDIDNWSLKYLNVFNRKEI